MCGIAGLVNFQGLPPEHRALGRAMASTLRHRGPDDLHHYGDAYASLGHARLSIVDLDTGRQPIANEDGTLQVICNGEIYNHRALRDELIGRGHRFRTQSDTEVILHLYEQRGLDFVHALNGMFAIALWDARRRRLILVRDRLGIKPLYYRAFGHAISFGSELKALLAVPDTGRIIDPCALADYLTYGHVPAPRTIFQQIHKLEPACLLVASEAGQVLHRYWEMPAHQISQEGSEWACDAAADRRWCEAFESLLEDAVRLRLMADVPLGAFLSGGVDSSAIVTAMTRTARGSVLTHTVGFTEDGFDERPAARALAHRLGTDHREVQITPDAAGVAQLLAERFDEPFADSSAIPMYYLAKAARRRVTVALAGDGADEMLAGYRRYRFDLAEHRLRAVAPRWLRRSTLGVAGWLYPKADWLPRPLRAKRTLENIACDDVTGHLRSVTIGAGMLPERWLRHDLHEALGDYDPFERPRTLYARSGAAPLLNRLLQLDMQTLMADDILTKVDRMSMAVGLEVRVPLLDHRLVELASRMPPHLKLHGRTGKIVLRRALAGWIGEDFSHRPKKGFDVPMDAWFRGPLREMAHDLLASSASGIREWIRPEVVPRLLSEHERRIGHHGHALWTLLSLEMWARTYAPSSGTTQDSQIELRTRPRAESAPAMNVEKVTT